MRLTDVLPDRPALRQRLIRGADSLALSLDEVQYEQLLDYLALLVRWNRAFNLTAVRDPAEMVTRHLLDSLAVLPHLPPGHCIDVGTGPGLPGIPLAIARPGLSIDLLDSNVKKTRFLFQAVTALKLGNTRIFHCRVEDHAPAVGYDVVLSRAFASLDDMVDGCAHLLVPGGCFLAMKGQWPEAEWQAVAERCELRARHELAVPGLSEQRHLLELGLREAA